MARHRGGRRRRRRRRCARISSGRCNKRRTPGSPRLDASRSLGWPWKPRAWARIEAMTNCFRWPSEPPTKRRSWPPRCRVTRRGARRRTPHAPSSRWRAGRVRTLPPSHSRRATRSSRRGTRTRTSTCCSRRHRCMRDTGAPAWEAVVRPYLQLTLAMIVQRTMDEDVRVRWLRGPAGARMVELAGSIELVPPEGNGHGPDRRRPAAREPRARQDEPRDRRGARDRRARRDASPRLSCSRRSAFPRGPTRPPSPSGSVSCDAPAARRPTPLHRRGDRASRSRPPRSTGTRANSRRPA